MVLGKAGEPEPEVPELFGACKKLLASDLHLKAGQPPIVRIKTELRALKYRTLSPEDVERIMLSTLIDEQKERLARLGDVDYAYVVDGTRYRISLYRQRGALSVAARRVNDTIPTFDELHLPEQVNRIPSFHQGLVIVAGITGSGKSTTLASFIEWINQNRRCHIITIEDPIEYVFEDKKATIDQREVGIDVASWDEALKTVVRQDPDVILIGEMRDPESFQVGLTAAETGHLVFGTLHTSSASQTFGRILDLFPMDRHPLIRQGLMFNLRAILCQELLPSCREGVDRVPACEVLFSTPTVRRLIKDGEDKKLADAIRVGTEDGMMDFTESLRSLVAEDLVERSVAMEYAPNPDALSAALKGITMGKGQIV